MPLGCTGSVQAALLSLDILVARVDSRENKVIATEDLHRHIIWSDMKVSPGSENGACTQGIGRNSGGPYASSTLNIGRRGSFRKPPGLERIIPSILKQRKDGYRRGTADRVISEEMQDEHKEVGATNGTSESGEPSPRDPVEGRRCREYRTAEGKDA